MAVSVFFFCSGPSHSQAAGRAPHVRWNKHNSGHCIPRKRSGLWLSSAFQKPMSELLGDFVVESSRCHLRSASSEYPFFAVLARLPLIHFHTLTQQHVNDASDFVHKNEETIFQTCLECLTNRTTGEHPHYSRVPARIGKC